MNKSYFLQSNMTYAIKHFFLSISLRTRVRIYFEKGFQLSFIKVNEGHSWGNWHGLLDELLIYFYGISQFEIRDLKNEEYPVKI